MNLSHFLLLQWVGNLEWGTEGTGNRISELLLFPEQSCRRLTLTFKTPSKQVNPGYSRNEKKGQRSSQEFPSPSADSQHSLRSADSQPVPVPMSEAWSPPSPTYYTLKERERWITFTDWHPSVILQSSSNVRKFYSSCKIRVEIGHGHCKQTNKKIQPHFQHSVKCQTQMSALEES